MDNLCGEHQHKAGKETPCPWCLVVQLRAFALAIMKEADWPQGGDVDGFQIQELAEEYGLLVKTEQTKPCGENCHCLEYIGEVSEKEPATCYRKTPLLLGSESDASAKHD
jgi:hypothetical protein